MQLTSRQHAFLEELFDVYYEHRQQPIHYTELARALGVSNTTAYEVLKSLESKGYVVSEYRLANRPAGPGRSLVLFKPTLKALRCFRRLLGEDIRHQEWELAKHRVLEQLAADSSPDHVDLLRELVAAIPESTDPLSYCGRVLAASLVSARRQVWNKARELGALWLTGDEGNADIETLDLLPGFALGLSCASEQPMPALSGLMKYVRRYQSYLCQMDHQTRVRLLHFSREIMRTLQAHSEVS